MAESTYAPLPLFRVYLGLPADDESRNDLLMLALRSATRQVDRDTGRRFGLEADPAARVYEAAGRVVEDGRLLLVDDIGDVEGLVVELGAVGSSWAALPDGAVTTLPVNAAADGVPVTGLWRSGGWPGPPSLVRVTARWGWPGIPEDIVTACLIRATQLFKRKDSAEGVLGGGDWGVVRVSARVDPDYAALIGRYSRGPVFA